MNVVVRCPKCDAGLPVSAREAPAAIACGRCGRAIPLSFSQALRDDTHADACPVCAGREFYIRKDFDPKVGLSVVVVGAVISAGFYWVGQDLIAYGILAVAVIVDLLVYRRLRDLTVAGSAFPHRSIHRCLALGN